MSPLDTVDVRMLYHSLLAPLFPWIVPLRPVAPIYCSYISNISTLPLTPRFEEGEWRDEYANNACPQCLAGKAAPDVTRAIQRPDGGWETGVWAIRRFLCDRSGIDKDEMKTTCGGYAYFCSVTRSPWRNRSPPERSPNRAICLAKALDPNKRRHVSIAAALHASFTRLPLLCHHYPSPLHTLRHGLASSAAWCGLYSRFCSKVQLAIWVASEALAQLVVLVWASVARRLVRRSKYQHRIKPTVSCT